MKRYKFIGNTANGLGYKASKNYDLIIVKRPFVRRAIERLLPPFVPTKWEIIVTYPIFCPYADLKTFQDNWVEVEE